MANLRKDDLMILVSSMNRAEKRHFRLFAKRNQSSENLLFIQLFDLLDRYQKFDEELVLKRLPEIKKRQLSNIKSHLYKQLLRSLRLFHSKSMERIQLREMVDYAYVLYNKGLYRMALDQLEKSRSKAEEISDFNQLYEVLEFTKYIESQYVTGSIEGRAEELTTKASQVLDRIQKSCSFSNLSLQLYSLYLKVGYVKTQRDSIFVKEFFKANLPSISYEELDELARIQYCQAFVWYNHLLQDFAWTYRYASKWVGVFLENRSLIPLFPVLYLKGLHNLLNALYNVLRYDSFVEALKLLEAFKKEYSFANAMNIEGLYYSFFYIHQIKHHFFTGAFGEGLKLVEPIMECIDEGKYHWDEHRIMLFYYRIACLYFGSGDNDEAILYLNKVIQLKSPDYRADIQCFARILNLIAHFELGNERLVEYQVKSVYRFLLKSEELQEVQKEIFKFLRKTPRIRKEELKKHFRELRNRLMYLQEDPYEKRAFLYLDIISWLDSKIEERKVGDVIRDKFLAVNLKE